MGEDESSRCSIASSGENQKVRSTMVNLQGDWLARFRETFCTPPILETERLVLRPLTLTDAASIFAYASDELVARFTSWPAHRTLEDTQAFLDRVEMNRSKGEPTSWAVIDRDTGRLIGTCGFVSILESTRSAILGYAFARDVWGRGFATEAASRSIAWGFETLHFDEIEATCLRENIGSARVLEKIGMTQSENKTRPEIEYFGTLIHYAITRSEWTKYRQLPR